MNLRSEGGGGRSLLRRDLIGWSFYDFANTIYSMNIVSLYLKRYIVEDLGKDDRYFDIPFSISMLLAALLLPALGAMSDHATRKKIFLFLFTVTCCLATGFMAIVPPTALVALTLLFIIANFSYEAGQPFYNSLLYSVADGREARWVSGVGVALGYVGSVVGMLVVLPFVTGGLFSIEVPFIEAGGKVAAFLPSAVLFMFFALPLFLWVREKPVARVETTSFVAAYREVWAGLRETKKYPGVLRFLIADYFFEDVVTTVILNIGLYCSLVIGFGEAEINYFLIVSTISAVIGSFLMGKIARHWSLKKLLNLIVWGWVIVLILFVVFDNRVAVWILGPIVGILMGGLWTTSRPLLAELVPRAELGRFFGIFSLSGRAAAVVGPLIWTTIVYYLSAREAEHGTSVNFFGIDTIHQLPYKAALLSLVVMLLVGLFIFRKVPDPQEVSRG
ncbi:MAG: MFS transporter [candidate division Zixibacteria bacterium]|nr:MFS transporter [candidate division Zixibacteria bacterium]